MQSDSNYEVQVVEKQFDARDDNVDVFVYFADGRKYVATFFTLQNVQSIMARHRETGESAGGRYFWAADAIIVDRLDAKTIETVVADLLMSGEFEVAFSGPHSTVKR
jgi:hypothetical protein